jgi:linoleate 10R-lipoxygenase
MMARLRAYRWHSCISENDEKWTEEVYKELFGKKADEISLQELLSGLSKWEKDLPADPMKRPFAHLNRGEDGKFNDDDLVRILQSGIEDVAGETRFHPPAAHCTTDSARQFRRS